MTHEQIQMKVYAQYADGCFCERRELGSITVPYRPRFNFAAAVQELAKREGIIDAKLNRRTSSRSANGTIAEPCKHRESQWIRFHCTLV